MEVSSALDDLWAPPSNYIKKHETKQGIKVT